MTAPASPPSVPAASNAERPTTPGGGETAGRSSTVAEGRCGDCEWTPSGFLGYPCETHGCESCRHLRHDSEDGCGHPDPLTGWCECETDSLSVAAIGCATCGAGDWNAWEDCPEHSRITAARS